MLINTHCHIFNLQSVFTSATERILKNRLDTSWLADDFAQAIIEKLQSILKHGPGTTPQDAIKHTFFKKFFAGQDMKLTDPLDITVFISIAFAKNMNALTDHLMRQMGDEDIIVPLMMDITLGDGSDDTLFKLQRDATLHQCSRYPGRILPFYAVNPIRPGAMKRLNEVIDQGGFVGVKLYPALGHRIEGYSDRRDDPNAKELPGVLDILKRCNECSMPVIQHCSHGGFYADKSLIHLGDPECWAPYLFGRKKPHLDKLRVDFAHFGGRENEIAASIEPATTSNRSWAQTILAMMDGSIAGSGPCNRVYTDLSCLFDAATTKGFFKSLNQHLDHKIYGKQILWGTDYFLLEMRVASHNFTHYFRSEIRSKQHWTDISVNNPQNFLGLNLANPAQSEKNILNHVDYLAACGQPLEMERAAPWIKGLLPPDVKVATHKAFPDDHA